MRAGIPAAVTVAALLVGQSIAASGPAYPSPDDLVVSPDGKRLYVVCTQTGEVVAVDLVRGVVTGRTSVGRVPRGVAISADGRRLFVTNSWSDTVSDIDAQSLRIDRQLPAGVEPTGIVVDNRHGALYVANRLSNDVSVIDLKSGRESRRIAAGLGASYVTIGAGGSRVYVTHIYPKIADGRAQSESEITVIDTERQAVESHIPLRNAAGVFHIAWSRDGALGVSAELRPKNLVPLAHVEHGWAMGNSLAIFGPGLAAPVQLPLDEIESYFSLPFGVAIAPDRSSVYVSGSGANEVAIIDSQRLMAAAKSPSAGSLAYDLTASALYVRARVPVGRNPRAIAVSPGGETIYVANRLDDTVSVVDAKRARVSATIALGGSSQLTPVRRGERIFYSAGYTFGRQFGCASCHLDATIDGLSWDLGHDRFGSEIVDTKALEAIGETAPFKWNGTTADLETECGAITERFIFRSEGPRAGDLKDLVAYLNSIPLRPNRYRSSNGRMTEAQLRGKAIFERTSMKSGTRILPVLQCPTCHFGPDYTNREMTSVGTFDADGRPAVFDVPQLTNIAYSAPYLHDGSAKTLHEIFTRFNPRDLHGVTGDLTKEELDDLVEYLKTL